MRSEASILHVDLDAFFAAVEQRDKPSLRGKPVIVGGVGNRGVVATASYEARAFGVGSAMSMSEARRRCPNAAYLTGRFGKYKQASNQVMAVLRDASPVVEPLSLDEAYVDLAATDRSDFSVVGLTNFAEGLKAAIAEATGGLHASVGVASSKLVAKIASDLDKPNGLVVVAPGLEADLLRPMSVRAIPGVGPATVDRLRQIGVTTVADLQNRPLDELVDALGSSHGASLAAMAFGRDNREVISSREAKSISVEGTYDTDYADTRILNALVRRQATKVSERLKKSNLAGRTITLKVRRYDFSTHTRSTTLPEPVDDARTIVRVAQSMLDDFDTSDGVRLLGVGVSGLADWIQEDLFAELAPDEPDEEPEVELPQRWSGWLPGSDVEHDDLGPGWVWGSGHGRVTVRFETAETGPGPVRTFAFDDPALRLSGSPSE